MAAKYLKSFAIEKAENSLIYNKRAGCNRKVIEFN
jgi:hypothetical protein